MTEDNRDIAEGLLRIAGCLEKMVEEARRERRMLSDALKQLTYITGQI